MKITTMSLQSISLISVLINLLLTLSKILLGIIFNSAAVIAEGIHSGLDILSSFITFLGIKSAQKPVDEKHPYGYYRAESIAGFVVVILLIISALGIFYEGIIRIIHPEEPIWSIWMIILMASSGIVNEIMARVKFYFGAKFSSLALVADGQHSRADVVASLGVLVGIILIKLWTGFDALVAIIVGLYILFESWQLGKEVTDSLLDVSDEETEKKIRQICQERRIEISDLKTRKIASAIMADIKIKLDPKIKISEATQITERLEKELTDKIGDLDSVNISVESHEFSKSAIRPRFGARLSYHRGFESIELKKLGHRIIVPLDNGKISSEFGAVNFLVVDKDEKGKILKKTKIKNKFYESGTGHGVKFAKAISADEVWANHIGENAQNNLKAAGIKFKILENSQEIEKLIKE